MSVKPYILESILKELKKIHLVLSSSSVRLYGASVLIVYEGLNAWGHTDSMDTVDADAGISHDVQVKLIDFAHSSFVHEDKGPDIGALFGIEQLMKFIEKLLLKQ